MTPILQDIPTPITTKRLLIRPPMPGDGRELNAAVLDSFTGLNQWMPWASVPPSIEESEASARRAYAQWILREDLRLSIFEKGTHRLVGSTGLHRIDWKVRRFEIGYWGRTPDSGRGYMTEAVTAVTQFAFAALKARRVEIRSDADNLRSIKIPEKLGFQLEARLRGDDTKPHSDEIRDTLIYVRFDANGLPDVGASWETSS